MAKAMIYTQLAEAKGLSINKLESLLGVSNGTIRKAIERNSEIKPSTIEKIVAAFPDVRREWLYTGDGPLFVDGAGSLHTAALSEGDRLRAQKAFGGRQQQGIIAVPLGAQAGYTKHFADPVFLDELPRFTIPNFPYDGPRFRAFPVEGDSMTYVDEQGVERGLLDGQWIICELVEDWKSAFEYYVHVFITESQLRTKRLLKLSEEKWVLSSDNPAYHQEVLDLAALKELWIFKRKLDWDAAPPRRIEIDPEILKKHAQ